ncbi:MAG: DUF2905 domain-containing protein [Chloroherpetonaceae bacterium]|nr:DUF2905 domain-containing protein [Chloroherpetonaceae bacterium]MDW8437016.1 DUF2905 domain-containing protein [Chloroherpetonaceae bacterium]
MSESLGKTLIFVGLLTAAIGVIIVLVSKSEWFGWFGNLPLDFKVERENFKFYFPLGTSILLSVVLSLLFYLFRKFSE